MLINQNEIVPIYISPNPDLLIPIHALKLVFLHRQKELNKKSHRHDNVSLEEIKQFVWKFIDEIFNKGNVKDVNRFVTPEFIYHSRGEDIEGLGKFKEWISSDVGVFSDNIHW